jgi:hypothetical protein
MADPFSLLFRKRTLSAVLEAVALPEMNLHGRIMEAMTDTHEISEHPASLKREIHDLRETDARYWRRNVRTEQDKSAHVSRQGRLLQIKQELLGMMQRYATSREYSATRQKSLN